MTIQEISKKEKNRPISFMNMDEKFSKVNKSNPSKYKKIIYHNRESNPRNTRLKQNFKINMFSQVPVAHTFNSS
jgi:hypothetical protein